MFCLKSKANVGNTVSRWPLVRGLTIIPRCKTKLVNAAMKPFAMPITVRISLGLGLLACCFLSAAGTQSRLNQTKPVRPAGTCFTSRDATGRPKEIYCRDATGRFLSRTYVDTAGRRYSLPKDVDQSARFGHRDGELQEYMRMRSPWPGNYDITGSVLVEAFIGTDGLVKDVRILKGMDQVWPGCDAQVRRKVLTMPRWRPAQVKGQPAPSVVLFAARFGLPM